MSHREIVSETVIEPGTGKAKPRILDFCPEPVDSRSVRYRGHFPHCLSFRRGRTRPGTSLWLFFTCGHCFYHNQPIGGLDG